MGSMICKTVYYSGRVQGVGFRFTTQRIAAGHPVTGYVKNLPDGRVELVVEAEPQQVDRFLDEVAEKMSGCIESVESDTGAATGSYSGFEIRY